jgi:hypothetical protein
VRCDAWDLSRGLLELCLHDRPIPPGPRHCRRRADRPICHGRWRSLTLDHFTVDTAQVTPGPGSAAARPKRNVIIFVSAVVVVVGGLAAAFVLAWGGSPLHQEATTGIMRRDGVPVVFQSRCGKPTPLDSVEVRVAPSDGRGPTDRDPVVFSATATGDGSAEVSLAQQVDGYTVETFTPLNAGERYYFANTRYIGSSGDGAPTFTVSDLSEDTLLVLYPLVKTDEERRVQQDAWLRSTAC